MTIDAENSAAVEGITAKMKNTIYATILAFLIKVLTLSQTYIITPAQAQIVRTPPTHLTAAQVYALVPQLRPIFACESTGDRNGTPRQFLPSGGVLWGNNPITGKVEMKDVGEAKIDYVHFADARAKGLDVINSENDNVFYAYLLWQKYGTEPWNSSRGCWNS